MPSRAAKLTQSSDDAASNLNNHVQLALTVYDLAGEAAEREGVYQMWEASEFRDPELRHKHLDLDDSVAMAEQMIERLLKFLPADEQAAYKKQSPKAKPPIRLKGD
ncbi:hypothetical protein PILCRDRAFT_6066 [Piloderma croceum F 1598]|uniref:Uncharacterized protein n=1 Tax=Piloderma croceum (strain F 1598) TaxID=765440 RepID=A0A0C3BFM8_PILCF|nr:hypothetical protein PILCRDRAFT_6066 [Piloderma croceum F 1598]